MTPPDRITDRSINSYPGCPHRWEQKVDVTLHGEAKWVSCLDCGELACDYITTLEAQLEAANRRWVDAAEAMKRLSEKFTMMGWTDEKDFRECNAIIQNWAVSSLSPR